MSDFNTNPYICAAMFVQADLTPTQRLVLLCLAAHTRFNPSNKKLNLQPGETVIGVKTLMAACGTNRGETITVALKQLVKLGFITRTRRKNTSTLTWVDLDKLESCLPILEPTASEESPKSAGTGDDSDSSDSLDSTKIAATRFHEISRDQVPRNSPGPDSTKIAAKTCSTNIGADNIEENNSEASKLASQSAVISESHSENHEPQVESFVLLFIKGFYLFGHKIKPKSESEDIKALQVVLQECPEIAFRLDIVLSVLFPPERFPDGNTSPFWGNEVSRFWTPRISNFKALCTHMKKGKIVDQCRAEFDKVFPDSESFLGKVEFQERAAAAVTEEPSTLR